MIDITPRLATPDDTVAWLRGHYLAMFIHIEDRMTTVFAEALDRTDDKRTWPLIRQALLDPLHTARRIDLLRSILEWDGLAERFGGVVDDVSLANRRRNYFAHYAIFHEPGHEMPWHFMTPFTTKGKSGDRRYAERVTDEELQAWFDHLDGTIKSVREAAMTLTQARPE